ncbi:hypothetical protein DFH06DRAFT_1074925 [Mycena polygramma]|nr:hypothetical protein DFH06DRAFT_1074925 [Mycena polygramma]
MSSSASARQIVVDDTDPAIRYGKSGWSSTANVQLSTAGNFGPPYNSSQHVTTSNATFNYEFTGTSITVSGTLNVTKDATTGAFDPTWICFLDEIAIPLPNPTFDFIENNWVLCQQTQLTSGSHNLTVQVQSKGQAFYFDDLMYTPLPDVNFESAVEYYQTTDPGVSYGSGWAVSKATNSTTSEPQTQTHGAQVALNFYGTSVSPYSVIPAEVAHPGTSGTYTIDNGSPVTFKLAGIPDGGTTTMYNMVLFTTPSVANGLHSLVMTYGGDAAHTPLVVSGFYVTSSNGTLPSTSSVSSPAASPSPSSSSVALTLPAPRHSSTAAIAGGVVGGLLLLALATGLALWLRKRNRQQQAMEASTAPRPMDMINGEAPPLAHLTHAQYNYSPVPRPPLLLPEAAGSSGGYTETTSSQGGSSYSGDTQLSGGSRTGLVASQETALGKIARETAATRHAGHAEDVVLVRHEDSGLRLAQSDPPGPRIVDLPPGYTPE